MTNNTLVVTFTGLPLSGNTITFVFASLTRTITFDTNCAIEADVNTQATTFAAAVNTVYPGIFTTSAAGSQAFITGIADTNITGPQSTFTTPFVQFTQFTVVPDVGVGETVNIRITDVNDVAAFLATDFLDLGGKNNEVAYRNPQWMNFYDNNGSAPGIYGNSTIIICKDMESTGGIISSYQNVPSKGTGAVANGGFSTSSNAPGWEWGNRSFMIRDANNNGNNLTQFNEIITDINQSSSTCAWQPSTLGINGLNPIAGSCNNGQTIPISGTETMTYNISGMNSGSHIASGLGNVSATSNIGLPYTFSITLIAESNYEFRDVNAIYKASGDSLTTIDSIVFGGTYVSGYSQVTITFTDSFFGGGNKSIVLESIANAEPHLIYLITTFQSTGTPTVQLYNESNAGNQRGLESSFPFNVTSSSHAWAKNVTATAVGDSAEGRTANEVLANIFWNNTTGTKTLNISFSINFTTAFVNYQHIGRFGVWFRLATYKTGTSYIWKSNNMQMYSTVYASVHNQTFTRTFDQNVTLLNGESLALLFDQWVDFNTNNNAQMRTNFTVNSFNMTVKELSTT